MGTANSGFFGKLPSRADFVHAGLARDLTDFWDTWFSVLLAAAQETLGDSWPAAWMEAPVWRFALPAGTGGPASVLGLWMPSTDRVGRHFPLTIAASCPGAAPEQTARFGTPWLDAAEDAGRAAIADDLAPDELKLRIPPPSALATTLDAGLPYNMQPRHGAGLWWTEGSPRVPAQGLVLDTMPDAATFVAMLDAARAR